MLLVTVLVNDKLPLKQLNSFTGEVNWPLSRATLNELVYPGIAADVLIVYAWALETLPVPLE